MLSPSAPETPLLIRELKQNEKLKWKRAVAFWYIGFEKNQYKIPSLQGSPKKAVSYTSKASAVPGGTQNFRMINSRTLPLTS